jgi:hypothetical protein
LVSSNRAVAFDCGNLEPPGKPQQSLIHRFVFYPP